MGSWPAFPRRSATWLIGLAAISAVTVIRLALPRPQSSEAPGAGLPGAGLDPHAFAQPYAPRIQLHLRSGPSGGGCA